MKSGTIIIYTDGSSRGNPGPGGWGTVVVWNGNVNELGAGEKHTTNNRMELTAAIEGLSFVRDLGDAYTIHLRTDSSYVINGITKWVAGWEQNGWRNSKKEEVVNRDLWEALALNVADLKMSGSTISWCYVAGHSGIPGNERVDEIATQCADGEKPKFYNGAYANYGIDLESLEVVAVSPKQKKSPEQKSREKMKAFSYLSLVNGKLTRHLTWDDCEKHVKGVKNVKFKKALSIEDEKTIMTSWGL